MDFDIRIPIGLLFIALGGLLVGYGLLGDQAIYRSHSLGVNINLGWGAALLLFGIVTLGVAAYARRHRARRLSQAN